METTNSSGRLWSKQEHSRDSSWFSINSGQHLLHQVLDGFLEILVLLVQLVQAQPEDRFGILMLPHKGVLGLRI